MTYVKRTQLNLSNGQYVKLRPKSALLQIFRSAASFPPSENIERAEELANHMGRVTDADSSIEIFSFYPTTILKSFKIPFEAVEKVIRTTPLRIAPDYVASVDNDHIFVFGSNLAGNHAKGTAFTAKEKFGASQGQAKGIAGRTYAIPIKDADYQVLSLNIIEKHITEFIEHAKSDKRIFLVDEIGCKLAGYQPEQIAPMFKEALKLENVYLPSSFIKALEGDMW